MEHEFLEARHGAGSEPAVKRGVDLVRASEGVDLYFPGEARVRGEVTIDRGNLFAVLAAKVVVDDEDEWDVAPEGAPPPGDESSPYR